LSGADLVHDIGILGNVGSAEVTVLCDELIDMVKVSMGGIEINDDTLPLDLIEKKGPRSNFISEKHTLKHFRKFWAPTLFDRSVHIDTYKSCEERLREKTIKIMETHQPRPLADDVVKELNKCEASLLKRVGLKEYPKRK